MNESVKMWSKIVNALTYLRDRITIWAYRTTREINSDEESDDENDEFNFKYIERGRGMRTEQILRAIIHLPVRWFQNVYHARKLEKTLNKAHPECAIRVKVTDKLVGNWFFENTFDYGLIVIPLIFILSFFIWVMSRVMLQYRWHLELASLITAITATFLFISFGLLYVFAAFYGYEYEYLDARKCPKRKKNPRDSYTKLA